MYWAAFVGLIWANVNAQLVKTKPTISPGADSFMQYKLEIPPLNKRAK
jgi:hypothetical protein